MEHFLYEAFSLRCSELYHEYQATFDTINKAKIESMNETSQKIAADITYFYPEYFKNMHGGAFSHEYRSRPAENKTVYLPLLGESAAGKAIEINELIQGYVPVDIEKARNRSYLVRAKGDSIIEAGISDGDLVIIRPQPKVNDGEIALVKIDNESTLKYVRLNLKESRIELIPANPAYSPMVYPLSESISIKGKVIGVIAKAEAERLMRELD